MNTQQNSARDSVESTALLADLKRSWNSAVREYETAIMRRPTDESEIRRAVDRCRSARLRFNAANSLIQPRAAFAGDEQRNQAKP
jgi:hypothetical protein